MLEVISLGAGVQSTCMALMAAHGEIEPMPDAAVFVDVGAEPEAVYEHLAWLSSGNVLPFPVHVTACRNLADDIEASSRLEDVAGRPSGYVTPPFHTLNADGSKGLLRRECMQNYKLDPLRHELKRLLGRDPTKAIRLGAKASPLVRSWIGISADEWHRAKKARTRWERTFHPLIEEGRWMTRGHCLEWLKRHDYPEPPRSACWFCPYRSNAEWRALAANAPADFQRAVEFDAMIRDFPERGVARLKRGGSLYLHRSCEPLGEVDLTAPDADQIDLWQAECEGMCSV